MTTTTNDSVLIDRLGGVAVLAKRMKTSIQRVQNWKQRGIPPKVKLEHPEIFLTSIALQFYEGAGEESEQGEPAA